MTCWLQKYLIAYYRIVDKAKIIRNSFFGISRDTILVPQSKLFASPRASDHQSFKYMSRDSLKRVVGDILSHKSRGSEVAGSFDERLFFSSCPHFLPA